MVKRTPLSVAEVRLAGGYDVIYSDPPWQYDTSAGRGVAENHYRTTGLEELKRMPVGEIAARDCAHFMWVTCPMVPDAIELAQAWGFAFKTVAFTWVKYALPSCRPFYGQGRFTRANTEMVLLFTRGKPKRVCKGVSQIIETSLDAMLREADERAVLQAGIMRHSRKPDEVRERIVQLMGVDTARIELFARERNEGWDAFGDDPALGGSDVILEPGPGVFPYKGAAA